MKLICISTIYLAHAGWGFTDIFGGKDDSKSDHKAPVPVETEDSDSSFEDGYPHPQSNPNPSHPPSNEDSGLQPVQHVTPQASQPRPLGDQPEPLVVKNKNARKEIPVSGVKKTALRQSLEQEAAYHSAPDSPVDMALFLSTECAYSQDFCERHLFNVMENPGIPAHLKVVPQLGAKDIQSSGDKCVVCTSGDESQQRGCKGNLAVAFVQKLSSPEHQKAQHVKNTITLFQKAPYNGQNSNIDLWEDTFEGLPDIKDKVRELMADCRKSQELIEAVSREFELGKKKAEEEFATLGGDKFDDVFPYFFLDEQLIPLHEGIMVAEGFGLANLEDLICVTNPNVPACVEPMEKFTLFHGSDMMVSAKNFVMVIAALFAAATFVTWLISAALRVDTNFEGDAAADTLLEDA